MATRTTKTHICDRCGTERDGQVGQDFDGGYVSFGPINGALSDHVGSFREFMKPHADICEECRLSLLRWWQKK